ncbi:MAG: type II toxin-antitoxin system RelE/ParE family toxin [Castellaniella sp.]|uniref:type II toxin-antitoxin system RelE/ParE family toxin n=1 Tax=Castellaniella sp. TaxID=1955812 RepID=UPI0012169087|nr:type II toxin-antitoxin system RelE/ParE family toxin [Castellaniella sp.]TAN28796.1 MAG: type II toxin-antitoxin system RelE/ParE family toxin [Castellaniella sp.]
MELKWTGKALSDLARLHDFLAPVSGPAAARVVQALVEAPGVLLTHPRLGEQLFQFSPREVRRILARNYEIRYEVSGPLIFVLRVWHTREAR